MGILKETIEQIAHTRGGKTEIANARGMRQEHSSHQYESFLRKIEDIERCLSNLGLEMYLLKKK